MIRSAIDTRDLEVTKLLDSMIRIVQLDPQIIQNILYRVHDLHKIDLSAATHVLDILLPRVAELELPELTERTLITRIWLATMTPEEACDSAIGTLSASLQELEKKLTFTLGAKSIHAAQIVIAEFN